METKTTIDLTADKAVPNVPQNQNPNVRLEPRKIRDMKSWSFNRMIKKFAGDHLKVNRLVLMRKKELYLSFEDWAQEHGMRKLYPQFFRYLNTLRLPFESVRKGSRGSQEAYVLGLEVHGLPPSITPRMEVLSEEDAQKLYGKLKTQFHLTNKDPLPNKTKEKISFMRRCAMTDSDQGPSNPQPDPLPQCLTTTRRREMTTFQQWKAAPLATRLDSLVKNAEDNSKMFMSLAYKRLEEVDKMGDIPLIPGQAATVEMTKQHRAMALTVLDSAVRPNPTLSYSWAEATFKDWVEKGKEKQGNDFPGPLEKLAAALTAINVVSQTQCYVMRLKMQDLEMQLKKLKETVEPKDEEMEEMAELLAGMRSQ
jgi:hypothetical protein